MPSHADFPCHAGVDMRRNPAATFRFWRRSSRSRAVKRMDLPALMAANADPAGIVKSMESMVLAHRCPGAGKRA